MGSIICAHCDCGYEKFGMHLGGGMANCATYCNFPHYCQDCKILFEINIIKKKKLCPTCASDKVIAYDDVKACKSKGNIIFSWDIKDKIGRELKLTDGKYICPSCGKFNLTFLEIGNWD